MVDNLSAARDAVARHDFAEALAAFEEADRSTPLAPSDVRLMAEAAWWSGNPERAVTAFERSFGAFEEARDRGAAAEVALRLCELAIRRFAFAIGAGWLAHAERLLADEPEGVAHAWLAFVHVVLAIMKRGDLAAAVTLADRALEIARAHGSRDVESLVLSFKGSALVRQGEWAAGLALIDEAAAAAASGALQPKTACDVYCLTIATCRDLADYRRAAEWTDEADRWMQRHSLRGYRGICRAHRAELQRLRGAWPEAEVEAREACAELEAFRFLIGVGFAYYQVGEVRLRMGDLEAADEAFRSANEFGHDPQPGWSLLLLARQRGAEAAASIARVIDAAREGGEGGPPSQDLIRRTQLLPAQVEIAVETGDLETARTAADELDDLAGRFESAAVRAAAVTARGALQLAEGDDAAAAGSLARAWRAWQAIDLPYESARARLLLGRSLAALGDAGAAELELHGARTVFERLGAARDTKRINELLGAAQRAGAAGMRVTKTFVFTDIVASTDLVRLIGDEAWEDLIRWHDRTLRAELARHRGEEVRHTGDGFFAAFDEAGDALACAVAIQRSLREARRDHGYAPSVRIGLHTTEAGRHGADYAGHGVHVAARIADIAAAGEIVASQATLDAAGGSDGGVSERRDVALKGVAEAVAIATVDWA